MNARLKTFFDTYGFALFAPLIALLLVGIFQTTGWVQRVENLTISLRFKLRAPWDPAADSRLLLVGIDQQSFDSIGLWPWPRTVEAYFLTSIAESGMNPKTVAFDLLLTDKYDQYHMLRAGGSPDMDASLGAAAGLLPSVITGAQSFHVDPALQPEAESATIAALKNGGPTQPFSDIVGDRKEISGSTVAYLPVEPLRKQSLFGFVDDTPSPIDGVRYNLPMVVRIGEAVYPSLALQTVCQVLHADPDKVTVNVGRDVVLRNSSGKMWAIPINDAGAMAINYRNSAKFSAISFKGLFEWLKAHQKDPRIAIPPEGDIDQKALLIGQVADGATDIGPTPLQARSPLVYTHFNAINNILRGDYLRTVSWPWMVAGYLAVSWISLFGLAHRHIGWSVGVPAAVIAVYILAAVAVFWIWSIEIAMAWPIAAYFGVQVVRGIRLWREEARSRQQLRTVFSQMLSPEVMHHVLSHPGGLELGGTTRSVTVLFSDIRDYTKISEHIGTMELVRQLNEYFGEMVECVTSHRGTFHKFIGDAIMAVWGDIASVSSSAEDDARNAVGAALEMRRKLGDLNRTRTAQGLLPLRIGIGLNFGEVLVGQIGAAQRSEFTVIGDPVNVASRLEGMTKEFHTDLAIGESVHGLLGDLYLTRRLGLVQLKGKSAPMMVFEVLAKRDEKETSSWSEDDLRAYDRAFDQFLARDFGAAEAGFCLCLIKHPEDYCVEHYLQAARDFLNTPPAEDWDGRMVMATK